VTLPALKEALRVEPAAARAGREDALEDLLAGLRLKAVEERLLTLIEEARRAGEKASAFARVGVRIANIGARVELDIGHDVDGRVDIRLVIERPATAARAHRQCCERSPEDEHGER